MENVQNILFSTKYTEIRIDLTKNFPVTVYGSNASGKKNNQVFLSEIVSAEDLPILINQIEGIMTGNQTVLTAHSRFKTVDTRWFVIRCELKKEKFGKPHLDGFTFDVSDYLKITGEDHVLIEYKRKNEEKADRINNRELTLTDIVDIDYLKKIQMPLSNGGVFSAIYDGDGNLICSTSDVEQPAPPRKHKFHKRVSIRISRVLVANWTISAPNEELLEKNVPLLEVLSQTLSRIANSFVVLYNEMGNTEHANKLLSEHIEQQILINNIYSIILERKDSSEALDAAIKLVGEYMEMKRICVYNDFPAEKEVRLFYEWKSPSCPNSAKSTYAYSEIIKIIERLDYTDIYLPPSAGSVKTEVSGMLDYTDIYPPSTYMEQKFTPEVCTVANLNGDGRRFGILTFAPLKEGYIPTAQESKVLRSVSQITATLLLQKQADEKLKETDRKLRRLAFYDPILNIPNRAMLNRDLENELISGNHGAAATIKITNLHTFNELFGHEYTDSILHDVARYISEIPTSNLAVYRFSGSTLMLLLRKTDEIGAKRIIEALLYRFGKPWKHESGEHYLDAGIGVTFYPDSHDSRDEIYRAASLALYKATEYGTNSYAFYSEDFKKAADINYDYAQKLRDAINDGMKGFSLRYQPMSDANGDLKLYEALVSWEDFPTPKLLRLAENMGFDILIDSWVIKNACDFCKKMQVHQPDFSISVNITLRELRSGSVISMVEAALASSGLDGRFLSVEIPERVFSERQDGMLSILKKLTQTGVNLIIDGFGSDFCGLSMFKHSYIDMIKVDFSLFTNIFGEFDEIWVNTVAKLAASLNNGICVKRVENSEQLEQSKKFGVNTAQGWLFAMPMSQEDIELKLKNGGK